MNDAWANVIGVNGTKRAEPGPDHRWFPWAPITTRDPLRWPGMAQVAVAVVLDLRAVEWERGERVTVAPPGGRGIAVLPDFPRMSHREFGHRVGIFRLLEMLASAGIAPAVAIDVLTVEHYRPLVRHLIPAVGEFLAGGMSASRAITSEMSEAEELHYIALCLDRLERGLGHRPAGWLGAEHGESARTPGLLGHLGIEYVADWCNDEQPFPLTGAGSRLWAFPLSWELSDLSAMHLRDVSPETYARSVLQAFDVLCADSRTGGRLLALHLHPFLSGQAFRADVLQSVFSQLAESSAAWIATPGQIVRWCRDGS